MMILFAEGEVVPAPSVLQLWSMIIAITVIGTAYLTIKRVFFPDKKHEDQYVTQRDMERELEMLREKVAKCASAGTVTDIKASIPQFATREDLRRLENAVTTFATRSDLQKLETIVSKIAEAFQTLYTKVEAMSVRYEGIVAVIGGMQNDLKENSRLLISVRDSVNNLVRTERKDE
jgi:hypothetical protein